LACCRGYIKTTNALAFDWLVILSSLILSIGVIGKLTYWETYLKEDANSCDCKTGIREHHFTTMSGTSGEVRLIQERRLEKAWTKLNMMKKRS
jgi:hypothetical protein